MNNIVDKLAKVLCAILLLLVILVASPILIGFGAVLLPVLGVIAAIIFIPIGIGVIIGAVGKDKK